MSKTQLQTNNAKLSTLITELQGKAAGGGSGGSVETCTVTVTNCKDVFYTSVEDGTIVSKSSRKTSVSEHTVQAVKNSAIFCGYMSYSYASTSVGAELIGNDGADYSAWKITSDNAIIEFATSGGSG